MKKTSMRSRCRAAKELVGKTCTHLNRTGTVVVADLASYAEPMLVVRFGEGEFGVLRPSEIQTA